MANMSIRFATVLIVFVILTISSSSAIMTPYHKKHYAKTIISKTTTTTTTPAHRHCPPQDRENENKLLKVINEKEIELKKLQQTKIDQEENSNNILQQCINEKENSLKLIQYKYKQLEKKLALTKKHLKNAEIKIKEQAIAQNQLSQKYENDLKNERNHSSNLDLSFAQCQFNITRLNIENNEKLQKTYINQQREIKNLKNKINNVGQLDSITEQKNKKNKVLTPQISNQNEELRECKKTKTNIQNDKNKLIITIKDQNATLNELKLNNKKLLTELKITKSNLTDCDRHILTLDAKIENLNEKIENFNCDDRNNNLITDLQNKYTKLESQFKNLQSNQKTLTLKLQACKNQEKVIDKQQQCPPFKNYTGTHLVPFKNNKEWTIPCNSEEKTYDWSIIERRLDFKTSFNRSWADYQNGFGDFSNEFFLGLEKIHYITNMTPHYLNVRLTDEKGTYNAIYDDFAIGDKNEDYAITKLGNYYGDAEDGLRESLNMKFSTFDRDNDQAENNCAKEENGGWWYAGCGKTNLNFKQLKDDLVKWNNSALKFTSIEMMLRPKDIE